MLYLYLKPLAIVSFLFFSLSGFSQQEKTLLSRQSLKSSGGWGGYRMQLTKIAGQTVQVSGFHLTGEYNRSLLIGYNFNFVSNYVPTTFNGEERSLRLNWHSLQLGYEIAAHRSIHPVLDMDFGLGRVKVRDVGKDAIFVLSPSAGIELNLYRWFHLSLEAGYRWVSDVRIGNLSESDFSGAFGQISFKFGWSEDFRQSNN